MHPPFSFTMLYFYDTFPQNLNAVLEEEVHIMVSAEVSKCRRENKECLFSLAECGISEIQHPFPSRRQEAHKSLIHLFTMIVLLGYHDIVNLLSTFASNKHKPKFHHMTSHNHPIKVSTVRIK